MSCDPAADSPADTGIMEILDLKTCLYGEAIRIQDSIVERRIEGSAPDTLILVEHPPVVTTGRLSSPGEVTDPGLLGENGIPVVRSARGGKATCHSPGQLVIYPVIDLKDKKKDIRTFIDLVERSVSGALRELGVPARRTDDRRGVWVGDRKIAFIGIAVRKWVTYHGVAVNINNSLELFSAIMPCGESSIKVTSASEYTGRRFDMVHVRDVFTRRFFQDLRDEYRVPAASACR